MDITEEDIAKLVLGYLKSENCKSAVGPFLETSRHLRNISEDIRHSKRYITQFHGYSLKDMLKDCARLYTIVMEFWEEATYPPEFPYRDMPGRLTFLLENKERRRGASCSSGSFSPPRSRSSSKSKSPENKLQPETSEKSDSEAEGSIAKVLAETMLERPELQERLAENINAVIQRPPEEVANATNIEFSAIRDIVKRTETDPVFEQMLDELINGSEKTPPEQPKTLNNPKQNLSVNTNVGDVILYEGTLEGYSNNVASDTIGTVPITTVTTTSSSLVVNSSSAGLLMVQPPVASVSMAVSQPIAQPYFLWNGQQIVNVGGPVCSVSEHDILSMPTVIMCDDGQQTVIRSQPNALEAVPSTSQKLVKIAPKPYEPKIPKRKIAPKKPSEHHPEAAAELPKDPKTHVTLQIEEEKTSKTPKSKAKSETLDLTDAKPPEVTSTPKSGSHVRALDFNFTPKQRQVEKGSKSTSGKISKSLFATPAKTAKSWDSDLRTLCAEQKESKSNAKKRKLSKKRIPRKESRGLVESEAKAIEDNLKSEDESKKKDDFENKSEVKVEFLTKETDPLDLNSEELPFTLINCSRPPRIKRKCNIDGSTKKEVKVTKVKEVKSIEISNNKMILSPSTLNANRRIIVENKPVASEPSKIPLTPSIYGGNSFTDTELLTLNFEKNVTPENAPNLTKENPGSKATRNLIPLLETPFKNDSISLPKTPNIFTPTTTKIFKEHLEGVDLTAIRTPQFPITPNLGITPYQNRPTDYSTSSSYYQPSDTEQNKSVEETKIVETKKSYVASTLENFNRNVIGKKNLSLVSKPDAEVFSDSEIENENDDSQSAWCSKEDTVIHNNSGYSLRSKNKKKKGKDEVVSEETIKKDENVKSTIAEDDKKDIKKGILLSDLERIRKETIASIKDTKRSKSKSVSKPRQRKLFKPTIRKRSIKTIKNKLENENSNFLSPINLVEAHLGENSKETTESLESKQESLIQNLKERGIYLLPKKRAMQLDLPDDNSSMEIIKKPEPRKEETSAETPKKSETLREDLNLTDSIDQITFDDYTKSEEDYRFEHDPNETPSVRISDYNFEDLKKDFTANVFVESLDRIIERKFSVIPMDFYLDIETESSVEIINVVTVNPSDNLENSNKKRNRSESTDEEKARKKRPKSSSVSDDLMNFAILGDQSERASPPQKDGRSKCPETCENLLSGLNVDHFLAQIHKG